MNKAFLTITEIWFVTIPPTVVCVNFDTGPYIWVFSILAWAVSLGALIDRLGAKS